MNLLCPNCQKMLTVPEQFAGQLMKCPLCTGTFTVPALPAAGGSDPAIVTPPPSSSPPAPPPPAPESHTYPLAPDPVPAFVAPPVKKEPPAEPAFTTTPKPKPGAATTPTPSSAPPGDYTKTVRVMANERILQWVPPAAMVLIFILQLFPWVGVYSGRAAALRMDAWDVAIGRAEPELDLQDRLGILAAEQPAAEKKDEPKPVTIRVGISPLMLFYLLFFLVTFVVTVFVAIQPFLNLKLPPQLEQLMPWKWAILTGLNVLLLLFLTFQCILNFDLENKAREGVEKHPAVTRPAASNKDKAQSEFERGILLASLQRTIWLRLAYVLHVLATAAVALIYWMERRGPSKPAPYFELRW